MPEAGRSFGAIAGSYARTRPTYPAAAVDFVLTGLLPRHIVDIGAGTGKLTEVLLDRAAEVTAVEPDEAMLAELRRLLPSVRAQLAGAENLDLPGRTVDALFAGQALHWFSRPDADYEMARVLRPGGVVGLLWNFPDTDVDWVADLYDRTTGRSPARHPQSALVQGLFDTAEQRWFDNEHLIHGPDGLLELVRTWSWVISQSAAEQAATDNRIRQLICTYPALQAREFVLPTRTRVIRQYRR